MNFFLFQWDTGPFPRPGGGRRCFPRGLAAGKTPAAFCAGRTRRFSLRRARKNAPLRRKTLFFSSADQPMIESTYTSTAFTGTPVALWSL